MPPEGYVLDLTLTGEIDGRCGYEVKGFCWGGRCVRLGDVGGAGRGVEMRLGGWGGGKGDVMRGLSHRI